MPLAIFELACLLCLLPIDSLKTSHAVLLKKWSKRPVRRSIGERESDVDQFVSVAVGIPAGAVAKMRKQRMDAGIDFLIAGCVLNLSALYVDNIKSVHCNLSELRSVP